jgi:glycosyltransferase involved in cell wall biosynthesis
LNGQHRNLRFLIVGDGSAKGRLEEEAKTLGLSNVEFTGHVPDVRPLLGTFDIFVLPSLYEGIPLGLLQAMAFECPVVATRVGGVPEVVVDGGTGYLIEPRDVQGLVDRLKTLSMDRSLRDTMGQAGRDRVVREFSARGMVEQTEQLYRRLRET